MKSMLDEVRALYLHLFLDLEKMHPTICTDLQRDLFRLRKAEVSLGLPLYTMALPDGCKWFDHCLSSEHLVDPRPPHFGVKGKFDRRPAFLHGLFSNIFEADGTLRLELDHSSIISIRQVLLLAKKLNMECEGRYTDKAVSKFHEIETSLPTNRDQTWDHNDPSWVHLTGHPIWGPAAELDGQTHLFDTADSLLQLDQRFDWEGFRRFSARILHSFGPFNPFDTKPKHGPGAVSDKDGSFVKYDFRHWPDKLESVFPYDYFASTNFSVPAYVSNREFPSKMCAVPKTQSGPRLIAAEPIAHQWIQQGILRWIEERLSSSLLGPCIDFRRQDLSKRMTLTASTDGRLATVDLSSASDRLSTRLVEYIFQVNRPLLDGLHASRTRCIESLTGETLRLKKFATQGSAVIFPVQSIVYCVMALWACARSRGIEDFDSILELRSDVRVFGDDIIVPSDVYPVLKSLFETLLLKVNETKSHYTGKFRESCGMDAYAGVDVTPAYFRQAYDAKSAETLVSVVECSNNFYKKGYWAVADYLMKTVPESERKLIPVSEGLGSVCLFSYQGEDLTHLRQRCDGPYQTKEVRVIDVACQVTYAHGNGNGCLTQFLFEEPDPLLPYKSGQASRPRFRKKTRWALVERRAMEIPNKA